jgi:hypothetical protein
LRGSALVLNWRLDFALRTMADSDQPPRFLNRQASTLGSGHFVFETTFRPEGEVLARPLLPANAGDCDRAAHDAYNLNAPMAILVKRLTL